MTGCGKIGCIRQARLAPKLHLPAAGLPIDLHQPATMLIGLKLCAEHATELRPLRLWGGPGK